ncbi:cell division protein ZipA [Xanthomonadaceae bacterium JHOS43]|nr:cell division protein ZipA [Xanthomonadaceae bacterium JHOS43]MCX7563712.1 cell division protein ZipA [Xanthomonadaceae bacterium XH05]
MNWNPDIGIPLAIAGVLILIAIAVFGRPRKPDQGRRVDSGKPEHAAGPGRREPRLGDGEDDEEELRIGDLDELAQSEDAIQEELELIERTLSSEASPSESRLGRRGDTPPQRIVTLFVSARDDVLIDGAAIVIAAEKAGLTYGHMGIFHRLVEGRPEAEPVFSVASLVKPGHFDLRRVHDIETPGLTFFMTLPGPVSALDAWETMLPSAQRMAELLDAVVLDEQRNALGRQRIAHIRDELRGFDREQEKAAQRRW